MIDVSEPAGLRWRSLYKLGGVAAFVIAALLMGETIVYAVLPRASTALEHFALFRDNWLAGLLTLDLLGMIAYLLFVPAILALYVALHRSSEAAMAVATVLFFLGVADFFATNTAFPVLALSQQYAAATTEADRAMALAAGQAMFTIFNENAFLVSYVIISAAWLMMSAAMLRSWTFSRVTAWTGILAGASGILAVVLEHVYPSQLLLSIAIAFYFAALVFLFVWVLLTGWRLYRLGSLGAVAARQAASDSGLDWTEPR
jgi:hypothetical protein